MGTDERVRITPERAFSQSRVRPIRFAMASRRETMTFSNLAEPEWDYSTN
jgi:hypothetical protein